MGRISAAQRHNFSATETMSQGNISASLNFNVTKNVTKQYVNQQREQLERSPLQRTTKIETQSEVNMRVPPKLAFEYLQHHLSKQQVPQHPQHPQQPHQQINTESEPYNFAARPGSASMRLPALPMNLKPPIRTGSTPINPAYVPYPGDFNPPNYQMSAPWGQNYNELLTFGNIQPNPLNRYAPSISSSTNPNNIPSAIVKPPQMMLNTNQTNMDNLEQSRQYSRLVYQNDLNHL